MATCKEFLQVQTEDWAKRPDVFLAFDEREILHSAGRISAEAARQHAESEFERFRLIQERLLRNDFDRQLEEAVKRLPTGRKGEAER